MNVALRRVIVFMRCIRKDKWKSRVRGGDGGSSLEKCLRIKGRCSAYGEISLTSRASYWKPERFYFDDVMALFWYDWYCLRQSKKLFIDWGKNKELTGVFWWTMSSQILILGKTVYDLQTETSVCWTIRESFPVDFAFHELVHLFWLLRFGSQQSSQNRSVYALITDRRRWGWRVLCWMRVDAHCQTPYGRGGWLGSCTET